MYKLRYSEKNRASEFSNVTAKVAQFSGLERRRSLELDIEHRACLSLVQLSPVAQKQEVKKKGGHWTPCPTASVTLSSTRLSCHHHHHHHCMWSSSISNILLDFNSCWHLGVRFQRIRFFPPWPSTSLIFQPPGHARKSFIEISKRFPNLCKSIHIDCICIWDVSMCTVLQFVRTVVCWSVITSRMR